MSRVDSIGMGNMAAASRAHKDDEPLPFLKKPSSGGGSKVEFDSRPATATSKRHTPSGNPMDKIFQQELQKETMGSFSMSNSFLLILQSPLFIGMCRPLVEQAVVKYLPPNPEKPRTTFLAKVKEEDKLMAPIQLAWPSLSVSIVAVEQVLLLLNEWTSVPSLRQFHGVMKEWTGLGEYN